MVCTWELEGSRGVGVYCGTNAPRNIISVIPGYPVRGFVRGPRCSGCDAFLDGLIVFTLL